ncbi:MAG: hypothetical protein BWY64_02426 [bacterium ADurb.Bin363]|nr:MAG: hypothetical protein BWY64_02426 [bacterium ADurb.Bin363]
MKNKKWLIISIIVFVFFAAGAALSTLYFKGYFNNATIKQTESKISGETKNEKEPLKEDTGKKTKSAEKVKEKDSEKQTKKAADAPGKTVKNTSKEEKKTDEEVPDKEGYINNVPVINELLVSEGTIFTNAVVGLMASASDIDGDSLTYTWFVSGGIINNIHANPTEWKVPAIPGNYSAKCSVDDGNGGSVSRMVNITVEEFTGYDEDGSELVPLVTDPGESVIDTIFVSVKLLPSESGSVKMGSTTPGDTSLPQVYIGDFLCESQSLAFFTFDISGLAGTNIESAHLSMPVYSTSGHPEEFINEIILSYIDWGECIPTGIMIRPMTAPGSVIIDSPVPGLDFSNAALKSGLQDAIDSGKTKFKVRLHNNPKWDSDSESDGWYYSKNDIRMKVSFSM